MKRTLVYATALLALLTACGQKENTTAHTQPGTSPQPKPLAGEPQTSPRGGNAVYPGNAPATPGGAPAPGEGTTPEKSSSGGTVPAK